MLCWASHKQYVYREVRIMTDTEIVRAYFMRDMAGIYRSHKLISAPLKKFIELLSSNISLEWTKLSDLELNNQIGELSIEAGYWNNLVNTFIFRCIRRIKPPKEERPTDYQFKMDLVDWENNLQDIPRPPRVRRKKNYVKKIGSQRNKSFSPVRA